jgi:hypothetical protein
MGWVTAHFVGVSILADGTSQALTNFSEISIASENLRMIDRLWRKRSYRLSTP